MRALLLVGLMAVALLRPPGANAEPTLPNCPPDKDLCVQADRTGGIDLKTGVANLEGNVRGLMRSRQLTFRSDTLAAYRDGGKEWRRLVLDQNVHITQRDEVSESDHGVLTRDEVHLSGHVRMRQQDLRLQGDDALIRADGSRTVVRGSPMSLQMRRALLPPPEEGSHEAKSPAKAGPGAPAPGAAPKGQPAGASQAGAVGGRGSVPATEPRGTGPGAQAVIPPSAPAAGQPAGAHEAAEAPQAAAVPGKAAAMGAKAAAEPTEPITTTLSAEKAVLEGTPKHAELTGNVHVVQSDGSLDMRAQEVTLQFTADSKLKSFRAQGNVVITQPDRRISADFAQSEDDLKTILLVGNATMQQTGQFELKSARMVVYADARKGILQSGNQQKPITLSMDLSKQTFELTQASMIKLSEKGLPSAVLNKLTPLIGHAYDSREAFRKAVADHLSKSEAGTYSDLIADTAHQVPASQ